MPTSTFLGDDRNSSLSSQSKHVTSDFAGLCKSSFAFEGFSNKDPVVQILDSLSSNLQLKNHSCFFCYTNLHFVTSF